MEDVLDECMTCTDGSEADKADKCPNSKRECGHHCDCSWSQDKCCWCGKEFGANEGTEEGDVCNRDGCQGTMGYPEVEGCTCHISPPCGKCTENRLVCNVCGEEEQDARNS